MFGYGSVPAFMQDFQSSGIMSFRKTIQLVQPILTEQQKNELSPSIRQAYERIFTNEPVEFNLSQIIPFQIKTTQMPLCNKTFEENEVVYKCHTCMIHDAAVQCLRCFQQSDHKGHRYQKIKAGGGNCDCGNAQAYSINGFCKRHPGKAKPEVIPVQEKQNFLQYFRNIFKWYLKLDAEQPKKGDVLGAMIAQSLTLLNKQSLYYNTLTAQLLYQNIIDKKSNQEIPLIQKIFCVTSFIVARNFCQLTLEMFSLQDFKYKLTKSYIKAYNTVQNFETSEFKDLFIQLLANTEVLQWCMKDGVFLNIYQTNRTYNEDKYLGNLNYLCTVGKDTAANFLKVLIAKSFMKTQLVQNLEASLKKGYAFYEQVGSYVNQQNYFQLITEKIYRIIYTMKDTLKIYLNKLINQIIQKKEFYNLNKVILPYHRILGMGLFCFFDGQISAIKADDVITRLDIPKQKLIKILTLCAKAVIKCYWQFSLTFCRHSYFDQYLYLYIQGGVITLKHDTMLLRICCYLLKQMGQEGRIQQAMLKLLKNQAKKIERYELQLTEQSDQLSSSEVMQEQLPKEEQGFPFTTPQQRQRMRYQRARFQSQHPLDQQIFQFYSRASYFLGILVQTTVSQKQELMFSHDILIKNPKLNERSEKLIQSYLNLTKEVTDESNKLFTKHFLANQYNEEIMNKLVQFNHQTKKMKPKKITNDVLNLSYYQSLTKVQNFFSRQFEAAVPDQIQISQFNSIIGNVLLGQKFLSGFIQIQMRKSKDEKTMSNLVRQLAKVYFVMPELREYITSIVSRIRNTPLLDLSFLKSAYLKPFCTSLGIFIDETDQLAKAQQKQKERKLRMKQIQNRKMMEMKQKQNKFKSQIDTKQVENMDIQQQANQSLDKCLICQENNQDKTLCSVIKVSNENFYLNQVGLGGRQTMLSITSCNHQIHFECYSKTFAAKESYLCPLCKKIANNVLPIPQVIEKASKSTIEDTLDRIDIIKSIFKVIDYQQEDIEKKAKQVNNQQLNGNKEQKQEFSQRSLLVFQLLLSFTELVGFKGLQNGIKFRKVHSKLAKTLIVLLKKYLCVSEQNQKINAIQYSRKKMQQWANIKEGTEDLSIFQIIFKIGYQLIIGKQIPEIQQFLQTDQIYKNLANPFKALIKNLIFQQIDSSYEKSVIEEQLPSQRWSNKLKTIFCPPKSIEQLMNIRDQNLSVCKNGHQIGICCLCGKSMCLDCKWHHSHTKNEHAKKSIYLSLMTGRLTYDIGLVRNQGRALYENQIGKSWKPTFEPNGYKLDQIAFKKLINEIVQGDFQDTIKKSATYFRNIEQE